MAEEKKPLEAMPFIGLLEEMYEKKTEIKAKQAEIKFLNGQLKMSLDTFLDEYDTSTEAINVAYKQYEKFNDAEDNDLTSSGQVEEAISLMNAALVSEGRNPESHESTT